MSSARVHVIDGEMSALRDADMMRRAVTWLTRNADDVADVIGIAAMFDDMYGGDDTAAGMCMTIILTEYAHDRDHAERVLLAADLLRRAQRTMH